MNTRKATPAEAKLIGATLGLGKDEIPELESIQGGLTNHSFRFQVGETAYFLRVPGQDTTEIINRHQEAAVYAAIDDPTLTDEVLALDPETGIKITRYWENARSCDPDNDEEVRLCMQLLRSFHRRKLTVDHCYDIFHEIRNYKRLLGRPSCFPEHETVEQRCLAMEPVLNRWQDEFILSHCDTIHDNFLFIPGKNGEELHLIDWEYAGVHDPCCDISMFASYGAYDRERVDWLTECYLEAPPTDEIRMRVYGYLALTGMMWSNWGEYKRTVGIDYGDYVTAQFRYAAEFSELFWQLEKKRGGKQPWILQSRRSSWRQASAADSGL